MTTIEVKFTDEEKKFLCNCIEAIAHEEPKCKELNGYQFSITEEQLPELRHMSLDVTIVLIDTHDNSYPPDIPKITDRFTSFSYKLIEGNDEVRTNLDASFEDRVIKSLEI